MASLSNYFRGSASKYLSAVDATPTSNQHEIGSNKFTSILGFPGHDKLRFNAVFLYFKPDTEAPEVCNDVVTYYDTRVGQSHRSAEYRLYYRDNSVTEQMKEGDFCLVGARSNGELMIAVTPAGSDHERRIRYLFEATETRRHWTVDHHPSTRDLDLASRFILEALGIELLDSADEFLDKLVEKFGLIFPTTKQFSAFARTATTLPILPTATADTTLEAWMKQEERLFRALEKTIVEIRLKQGFDTVESFVAYSLSVQNRRKSRVGHALENHLEAIFQMAGVSYERGARTEGNAKPDFLFPSAAAYRGHSEEARPLHMLAAKSTCKDRWRQILVEAAKIPRKHLLTLEPAISENQTTEMEAHQVTLVVTPSIGKTYTQRQQEKLLSLTEFIQILKQS